ncbi:MAG: cytochrome c3 family protein [Desulfobulbaceae bacterium]|nr:cytochrome c3 family protein [Desulfobulbaceae bacterium]
MGLPFPEFETVPALENDYTVPNIGNVQVLSVEKGIFLSATIEWQTDELADAQVKYTSGENWQLSDFDPQLTQLHRVTLTALKANKVYAFHVVSHDIFGNEAVSGSFSFDTSKALLPKVNKTSSKAGRERKVGLQPEFFRSGENYFLKITSLKPCMLFLGVPLLKPKVLRETAGEKKKPSTKKHATFLDSDDLNTEACYTCHEKTKSNSHPVNVLPKPGMIIPPEYPTLPDGRISCMSCHMRHTSNNDYRMIKRKNKELCVGCHTNMI